jgi:hypothetical protein
MIGASMNCRGVGKKSMNIFLSDLIKEQQLDFIGLQETIKKIIPQPFSGELILRINFLGNGSLLWEDLVVSLVDSRYLGLISLILCWAGTTSK